MTAALDPQDLPPPPIIRIDDLSSVMLAPGPMPFGKVLDPQLQPRAITAEWPAVRVELADLIERHHDQHPTAVVEWTVPGTGETIRVQWAAPPTIERAATTASVVGQFDEVLVF